ncbi:ninjurin-2 [Etheostoma cragini]|uniref:ninjurin-2 n=1 Tax=Etheostoma cragini TaxID=417921 RepID=UPI00155E7943|nr:ninjurin-2 [Etheostoma cragini]
MDQGGFSRSSLSRVVVSLCDCVPAVKCDLNDESKHVTLNRMNNVATVLVLFTVLINVFITALGHEEDAVRSSGSPVMSEPPLPPLPTDLDMAVGL